MDYKNNNKKHTLFKGYYLCIIRGGKIASIDGTHSRVSEVVRAKTLIEGLGLSKTGDIFTLVRIKKDELHNAKEKWINVIGRLLKTRKIALKNLPYGAIHKGINIEAMDFMRTIIDSKKYG